MWTPAEYKCSGMHFQSCFIGSYLPFLFRHGSAIFQRLGDTVRFIMSSNGHQVTNYIDNIVGYATKSQTQASFDTLYELLLELGFTISMNKFVKPTITATCLGISQTLKNSQLLFHVTNWLKLN